MTIEERLKEMMIQKSGSVNKFAHECGLSTSTVATMFTRGANKTNVNTIVKICKALNISADELSDGRITPLPDLTVNGIVVDIDLNEENRAKLVDYARKLKEIQDMEDGI